MRYESPGNGTSTIEVTNVSKHGLWLLLDEEEFFLPFEQFPWFKNAPIGKIVNVELPSQHHLYWPELDIDLEVESVLHPERYPMTSRVNEAEEGYSPVEPDENKIDDTVLALLQLTVHDGSRAWKGFDFEVMDRLLSKGYIIDPRNKSKSVALTDKGLVRSKKLFEELFAKKK